MGTAFRMTRRSGLLRILFVAVFLLLNFAGELPAADESIVRKSAVQIMHDYFTEQKYDEALAASAAALEEQPDSYLIHNMLAYIHWQRAEWDKMLASAEKALKIKDKDAEMLLLAGRARYMKKEYASAAETLENAFIAGEGTNIRNPEICFDLAAAYVQLNQYEKAIEWAQKAVSLDPGFATAHYVLGRTYFEAGKFAESVPNFLKSLELKESLTGVREYLGLAYAKSGDQEKARQTFQEILKNDPDNKTAKENLAALQ